MIGFSVTTPDPSVISVDPSDAATLPGFVEKAKEHGTVASISIGGWTGSGYFSSAVTPENRSTFVNAVLGLVARFNLDGVDFE
jgi:chitinase